MINNIFPKIHKEGHKFIAIAVILSFVGLSFSKVIGLIFILLTIWTYYFFRDPDRVSINQEKFFVESC